MFSDNRCVVEGCKNINRHGEEFHGNLCYECYNYMNTFLRSNLESNNPAIQLAVTIYLPYIREANEKEVNKYLETKKRNPRNF